jgi:alcohol dehydrogenase
MIDLDDNRLEVAKRFGATAAINSTDGKSLETVMKMTGKRGVDTAIEAVGIPATFELCQKLVAAGGTIANIGVHGKKADLHLEELWDRNISISHAAGRYGHHTDAVQDRRFEKDRSQVPHYAPI